MTDFNIQLSSPLCLSLSLDLYVFKCFTVTFYSYFACLFLLLYFMPHHVKCLD